MNALLLTAGGLLFALLLLLNNVLKTASGAQRVGFIDLLLLFVTVSLLVLSQVHNAIEAPPQLPGVPPLVTVPNLVRGAALALIVVGVLIMLPEARREQKLRGSRGVMTLWGGLLALITTFTAPVISTNFSFEPGGITLVAADGSPIQTTAEATANPDEPTPTPLTPSAAPTATATFTATPSRTPRPTLSPTPTREPIILASSTARPDQPTAAPAGASCLVETQFNLRLRAAPSRESDTLATIPFETSVTAFGRNTDSTWWYVEYEDERGWIDAEFTRASASCADLPVQPG